MSSVSHEKVVSEREEAVNSGAIGMEGEDQKGERESMDARVESAVRETSQELSTRGASKEEM